jgi:hypothetical protein
VASTGGAPIEKLKEYIKAQDSPIAWLAAPLRYTASLTALPRFAEGRDTRDFVVDVVKSRFLVWASWQFKEKVLRFPRAN